jgi:hypothetical protein
VLLYAIVFVVSLLVGLGVLWATEGVFRCALIGVICGTAAFTVGAVGIAGRGTDNGMGRSNSQEPRTARYYSPCHPSKIEPTAPLE